MEYLELGNNMKDYNSIIMCFFNKTLQEDYEPFITKSSKDVFYLADLKGRKELDQRLLEDMIGSERSNKYSRKYDISLGTYGSDMIPGIRLSEMYYIMGEYFARTNNFIKAGEMLDEVRFNRGIITTNLKIPLLLWTVIIRRCLKICVRSLWAKDSFSFSTNVWIRNRLKMQYLYLKSLIMKMFNK